MKNVTVVIDAGQGICPLFSSPPWRIWQLKSPHPREFAIQDKKMLMPGGQPGGGGGLGAAGIDTDALFLNNRLIQPLGCDVILNKLSFYIYPKKKEKHEAMRKSEKGYS